MKKAKTDIDVLCMMAHPDDAEILAGGTLIKLADQGHSVGIADFTRGEMGTRGNAREREREAVCAANIMGVDIRRNLGFPDAHVENTVANRKPVVGIIREFRPHLIITHDVTNRNPDHSHVSALVREAAFTAGLVKYDTGQEPHRPHRIIHAMEYFEIEPSFIVDISGQFERKMNAINCYRSQTYNPRAKGRQTYISSEAFQREMEARFRYYGSRIHCEFGEVFRMDTPVEVDDVVREVALRSLIPGQGRQA